MAVITKYLLGEQILRLVNGSGEKMGSNYHLREVIELAGQVMNTKLKIAHFSETMAGGERVPSGLSLATYEGISVFKKGTRSYCKLPAFPQQLPLGLGIFQIYPMNGDDIIYSCEYIPVPSGQMWMVQKESLISDLLGQVGYENYGMEILFTKDITTALTPVNKVMIRIAIVDLNSLGDDDILPLPADMASQVIQETYNILVAKRPEANIIDPVAEKSVGGNK